MHADVSRQSDGDLARQVAALAGAARAEEAELVRRFAFRVRLFGRRHLGSEALAADLAQDVMERLIERLRAGAVREPDRIGSFVLGIARMMATEGTRRARRGERAIDALASSADSADEPSDRTDLPRLEGCLGALPERERTVILLTFQGDRETGVIAAELGTSAGNVRVIRHRALARLRSCMDREARA